MSKETVVRGDVWMITGPDGKLLCDIDTDQIYHNAHLAVTDIKEMGKYAFGNLAGWKDFPQKSKAGDILFVGCNFGAGSSRHQAVDCFRALGITALIGESFGAIYKRNAINAGFPIIICPGIGDVGIKNGDTIEVDYASGVILCLCGCNAAMKGEPFTQVQMEIFQAGNLFAYGKKLGKK